MKSGPICGPRNKHPSGRPIRRSGQQDWPYRLPKEDGPYTLGLRKERQSTSLIGFMANLGNGDDDE